MQPFMLGGDAVQALILQNSSELQSATSAAFSDDQSASDPDKSTPGISAHEEAHLSVLVSDLDPTVPQQQYDFLVRAGP